MASLSRTLHTDFMSRHISLSGQPNFRDLGGYAGADGRTVKWRIVYRSGELSQLTEEDVDTLAHLGIKTVVDLRSQHEVSARGPSRMPSSARLLPLPIASGEMYAKFLPMVLSGDFSKLPSDLLERVNRVLVRDFQAQFGELLRALLDPANRPLVFHCTQGKDRAGFGAAMVLTALGVPWEVVMDDYLLSNELRRADNDRLLAMIEGLAAGKGDGALDLSKIEGLLYVRAQNLGAARDEIHSSHGDLETFLIEGLGCSAEQLGRLRDELLE